MATYPYISGPGNVSQMVGHLRKSFPQTVTSETVKKLGLAPNNESYVINALQFIGLVDADGKKTNVAAKVFSSHKDEDFALSFADLVKKAYSGLFELHGDGTWMLSDGDLITYFRQTDQTSAIIGSRQSGLFKIFASLAGHGDLPPTKSSKSKVAKSSSNPKVKSSAKTVPQTPGSPAQLAAGAPAAKEFGLSVRIEMNLPADGTKETYDNIFKSIRENLLNG
jgi:hypothetical protein